MRQNSGSSPAAPQPGGTHGVCIPSGKTSAYGQIFSGMSALQNELRELF